MRTRSRSHPQDGVSSGVGTLSCISIMELIESSDHPDRALDRPRFFRLEKKERQ
ncbi:hypothetical protein RISK_003861 [Rhodopirellula islandica]|uniref:Uncharacterized protein n=1 Tax=Rhodopirellula islandica TaxID=595434 RepID=A0A0J1BCB3_RHOIS|nr:hypothetical protein RISK_003861 [Rhodopirellula islandica]